MSITAEQLRQRVEDLSRNEEALIQRLQLLGGEMQLRQQELRTIQTAKEENGRWLQVIEAGTAQEGDAAEGFSLESLQNAAASGELEEGQT